MDMNIVCRFARQIQDLNRIPQVVAKMFPAHQSEAESLQLSFSSPVFLSFTPDLLSVSGVTHCIINNRSNDITPSACNMTQVFETFLVNLKTKY